MRTFGYEGTKVRDFETLISEVEAHMSETFGVDIHRYKLAFASEPSRNELDRVYRKVTGEGFSPGGFIGTCLYTGGTDLGLDHLEGLDFLVTVRTSDDIDPLVLSEELTHGEHHCKHVGSELADRRMKYRERFGGLSAEFIAALGLYSTVKEMEAAGIDIISPMEQDITASQMENYNQLRNYIAHVFVRDLFLGFDDVPCRDFFNESDDSHLWSALSEFAGKDAYDVVDIEGPYRGTVHVMAMTLLTLSPGAPVAVRMEDVSGERFTFIPHKEGTRVVDYDELNRWGHDGQE
ncbi:MAG: hypothetical protein JSV63_03040 [Candidatus Aenigmatarchaeota archaeon]|nr:MAG: hypothetical protein JSV63_03040 [Candidatus Aenigmarchaeota archaeon]